MWPGKTGCYRNDDHPFVFLNDYGKRSICARTILKWFNAYEEKLGTPMTPHTLRHTFAAHFAIKGMPLSGIQVLLGHDSPYQSQMYARLYNQARKDMYDQWM